MARFGRRVGRGAQETQEGTGLEREYHTSYEYGDGGGVYGSSRGAFSYHGGPHGGAIYFLVLRPVIMMFTGKERDGGVWYICRWDVG